MTYYSDSFMHAGLGVRIFADDDSSWANPREDDGNLGVMFCDYRGYTLGDTDAPDPREQTVTCPVCNGSGDSKQYELVDARVYGRVVVSGKFPTLQAAEAYMERNAPSEDARWCAELADCERCEGAGEVEVSIVEYLKTVHGARVILPLFVHEHGGITIRAGGRIDNGTDDFTRTGRYIGDGAGWDTSSVGVIFDTAQTREAAGWNDRTDEEIEAALKSEVVYYAAYLEGQVYGYEVVKVELDEDGEADIEAPVWEVLDSVGGMLTATAADTEYLKSEARTAAAYEAEKIAKEATEAHRWACADVITI